MARKLAQLDALFLLVSSPLLLSACANHKVNNDWPDVSKVRFAVVTTGAGAQDASKNLDRLKAYHQALQSLVGTPKLEDQYIGCSECERLVTGVPPTELNYLFFQDHSIDFYAFTKAWDQIQRSAFADAAFTLTFKGDTRTTSKFCPAPPACYSIPSCDSTDGCDKNKTLRGCQPC
jgi:hypothetical protein